MSIRTERNEDIVTLIFDMEGRSTNVLNAALTEPFQAAIESLEGDTDLKGVILTSAKRDFIAGADIDMLAAASDPRQVFQMIEDFKAFLRRLETLRCPVVAAMNGTALGGGYEVALAAHHRIALNQPSSRIGLPEVTLGLLPGGGGTTRLPRMIGIQNALPLLLEGKQLRPDEALAAGLVDELASSHEEMLQKSVAWIQANPGAKQPWDLRKFRYPGGDSKHPAVAQMWAIAPSMLRVKTHGNYRAPKLIMASVFEGSLVDFETASRIESRYFTSLACHQESKNMITAFWHQLNAIKKGASRPDRLEKRSTSKVGLLGAGMMGAGIAYVCAKSGMDVVLKDVTLAQAEKGKSYSQKLLDKRVRRGHMSREKADAILDKILITQQIQDLAGCDLIIEAVFEDRALKAQVTQETESVIGNNTVFASNTSTLPITGLAEASKSPDQFIGLHFFSPVDKMPLVEIILGKKTSDETLAKAYDFVQQIGKTPIVVNDSRGFYTSRVFSTYVKEGIAMLAEGVNAARIEQAGLQAGMPVGPLAVSDEVSLGLMHMIMRQTERDMRDEGKSVEDHPANQIIQDMVEKHERLGKKAGKGFYDYPTGAKKTLWHGLETYDKNTDTPLEEMKQRMLMVQALDTVRCYDEGVLTSVADANIGSIFGWGFAPFKGGTLQYINDFGLAAFVAKADQLADQYGSRFAVPNSLRERAKSNNTYKMESP
ncbi:MAG: enoyl-CoA hydratase/isomerase family protein [Acidobacteria bacterium]|nr:enoyl-CoA hydratase/isomerase family protein [Acidobacteriota bacterium]